LSNLGRLAEATRFHERSIVRVLAEEDWHNTSIDYRNLTSIHLDLGALGDAADAAHKALTLSCRAKDLSDEYKSLAWVAWVAHLCGRLDNASTFFSKAKSLWRRIDSANQHLVSVAGIQHATHLLRRNRAEEAHQVTTFNLGVVIKVGYIENICLCHSLLGDLAAFAGRHEEARENYNQAVQIARNKIAVRYVLIAVLAARGRWAARRREPALSDLEEALDYAIVGGYSLYEADIRVGLAWAYHAAGDAARAWSEVQRTQQMSAKMGYHWGQADARDVSTVIGTQFGPRAA
jgi:tetratricopeptide (TPR) repeat protein